MSKKDNHNPSYVPVTEKHFKKVVNFSQCSKTLVPDVKVSTRYRFISKVGLLTYYSCSCDVTQVKSWAYDKFSRYDLKGLIVSKVRYNNKMYQQDSSRAKSEYTFFIYFKLGRRLDTRNVHFFDLPPIASELPYHPVVTTKLSVKGNIGASWCNDNDFAEMVPCLFSDHVGGLEDGPEVYVSENIRKGLLAYNIDPFINWSTAQREK